jgi:hypothetical protein
MGVQSSVMAVDAVVTRARPRGRMAGLKSGDVALFEGIVELGATTEGRPSGWP